MVVNGENADSSDESAKTDVQNIDDSIIFRLVNDIKNINNNQEKSGRKITVKHYDLNNNEVITDMTGLDYEEKINQFIKIILEDLLTKKPLTFTEICNETGIYQSKAKKLIERFIDEEFIERYTDKKSTYFRLRRHDFID